MLVAFFVCFGLILYAYAGFPLLVVCWALVCRRVVRQADITPSVSMIIACYNEEAGIEGKLQNLLELDYPREQLEILIVSDGSTDATEAIVRGYEDRGVRLLCLPRGGKAQALNAAIVEATGEMLVFSDANSLYASDAIQKLVRNFADEEVGGVAGNQCYRKSYQPGMAGSGEQGYWNFDRQVKLAESRIGNTISATGAIYAIRRVLFQPVPENVTDDFVTSTRVIAQGYRLVFEPEAVCFEPLAGAAKSEFRRKTRVMTRGLRGVWIMRGLLNPFRYGFYSLELFSHKVLRRLVVFPLLVIAVLIPLLSNTYPAFRVLTACEIVFFGLALLGAIVANRRRSLGKLLSLPFYYCMVNVAVLVAVWNLVTGRKINRWDPQRGESPNSDETPGLKPIATS